MKKLLLIIMLLCTPAWAGNPNFWTFTDPAIRRWFPTVMQPGYEHQGPEQGHSCCGEADAFVAEIVKEDPDTRDITVVIPDGKRMIADGTVVVVPRNKIQVNYGNPTGKVIIFLGVSIRNVYCLIPLEGA